MIRNNPRGFGGIFGKNHAKIIDRTLNETTNMKIIPDLDSIIIEYQIDDKEKLLEVLEQNLLSYSRFINRDLWKKTKQNRVEIYQMLIHKGFIPNNYRWFTSPAKIVISQKSLTDKQPIINIKVQPTTFYLWGMTFRILIFFVLLSFFVFGLIKAIHLNQFNFLMAIIPLVAVLLPVLILQMHKYNYTKFRPLIIKSFEKIMTNHGIELQKLKETLQKFVLFRKSKRDT